MLGARSFLAVFALLAAALPVRAQDLAPVPGAQGVLLTANAELAAAATRIAERSALWRAALADAASRERRALLLTPDQVVVRDGQAGPTEAFDVSSLAEVSPVVRDGAAVDVVLVVVNVTLLAETHARLGTTRAEFEADLDRILIHEVYGHAIPYLHRGDTSARCADPERGQDPLRACSVRRENEVRAQAGLGERTDYASGGLVVMERLRRASALAHGVAR